MTMKMFLVKTASNVLRLKRKAEKQKRNAFINEKQSLNDKRALHAYNRYTIDILRF